MSRGVIAAAASALLLCLGQPSLAVNLIPNPSFETLSTCPTGFGQLWTATPWNAPNTGTRAYSHIGRKSSGLLIRADLAFPRDEVTP